MPQMKKMPSVMAGSHQFSQVPSVSIERSVFDRSHNYKTTFDAGLLIPVLIDWVLPGDTFTVKMTAFARLTTPVKPLMDNMYLESFFFFVPDRLVWSNFVKFMGEQTNPGDSISFLIPQALSPVAGYALGTLGDYFGLPTVGVPAVTAQITHSALPFRAYFLIYDQWFRDENLINSLSVPIGDGPNSYPTEVPRKRGKRHDYFTSALPFTQKGTAVSIPFTGVAAVKTQVTDSVIGTQTHLRFLKATGGGSPTTSKVLGIGTAFEASSSAAAHTGVEPLYPSNLVADLSSGVTSLINDLRLAFQTQKLLERDARGGTRYTELVWSHFRVKSPDARLQRSEYLGGGSTPVNIAPVAQTTQAAAPTFKDGLANLGGAGAALASGHGFTKSFTEHGMIIGIVNVRADLTYSQGMDRHWSHSTRYDRYWPVLAHIGEQAILNKEIYATGAAADALVFGYQERYAEYRYKPSKVTGLFRPTAAGSLEVWHLSEKFSALPTLGQTFIEDQSETILDTRVAVPSEPDFYFDAHFDMKCARPMPVYGVPGFVDHF